MKQLCCSTPNILKFLVGCCPQVCSGTLCQWWGHQLLLTEWESFTALKLQWYQCLMIAICLWWANCIYTVLKKCLVGVVKAEWAWVMLGLSYLDCFNFEVNWSELLRFLLLYLITFRRLSRKHFHFAADQSVDWNRIYKSFLHLAWSSPPLDYERRLMRWHKLN